MEMELLNVSAEPFNRKKSEVEIQSKNTIAAEQHFSQGEKIRIQKLIQEGNLETVAQILSHRRAVACVKKQV